MIREIMARPQEIAWLPWAVQYFFFIGLACGSIMIAVWLRWRDPQNTSRLELAAVSLAVVSGTVAPMALSADLHQPARIWHFYAYFTPWSWMSLGSLFLPLFTLLVVSYFILLLRGQLRAKSLPFWARWLQFRPTWREEKWLRWIALATLLSAISILLYTGREVSVLRAQPLWYSLWLPWLLLLTAMQAVPPLLACWLRQDPQWQPRLARYQAVSLLLLCLSGLGWWLDGSTSSVVLRSLSTQGAVWLWAGIVFVALALSLLVLAWHTRHRLLGTKGLLVQSAAALLLCWGVRWMLLMQTQTLPKFNVLANPYVLPLGSEGLLAILGTLGLWIALIIGIRELQHGLMEKKHYG
ncbi:tetrathionate reductase subunit TtrC [Serratia quinivorans]|uniref:tetrathionate reductase subunit TtrC n=1 Tax=Serratia quinivorans TaxID=137545 RepID=UPI00217B4757|nr:tetrathionate reductase subunit TtrC [Serratia quinivorans]CAI0943871.1 tetrathionate reductase subunit C [Serratia quinivorans]CAI1077365.1 tetrathionate reductase subunit C [Serratia quinivorans]CAI1126422.1 tetrathionate reductase subunit C [Serratia quinivorans]CAI1579362.1 tetrathionate reductase subunit C [Serratia quinivorans]CAI2075999.1 tetrathionate reductase subunit C [Serratia quinivorans]